MLYGLFQSAFFRWVALKPKRSSLLFPFAFYRYLVDGLPSVWNGISKIVVELPIVWNSISKIVVGLPIVWNCTSKIVVGLPSVWNGISKIVVGLPSVWNSISKIVVGVSEQFQPKEYAETALLLPFFQRFNKSPPAGSLMAT